jgi:hypothetical protein
LLSSRFKGESFKEDAQHGNEEKGKEKSNQEKALSNEEAGQPLQENRWASGGMSFRGGLVICGNRLSGSCRWPGNVLQREYDTPHDG